MLWQDQNEPIALHLERRNLGHNFDENHFVDNKGLGALHFAGAKNNKNSLQN